jgi:hypothetical protein
MRSWFAGAPPVLKVSVVAYLATFAVAFVLFATHSVDQQNPGWPMALLGAAAFHGGLLALDVCGAAAWTTAYGRRRYTKPPWYLTVPITRVLGAALVAIGVTFVVAS